MMRMVRTTINLDDDVLETARAIARAEGRRQSEGRRAAQERAVEVEERGGVGHYFLMPAAVRASSRLA